MTYEPPSEGSKRCMIYRPQRRHLPDGCIHCGLSQTACDGLAELQARRCCDRCQNAGEAH